MKPPASYKNLVEEAVDRWDSFERGDWPSASHFEVWFIGWRRRAKERINADKRPEKETGIGIRAVTAAIRWS